MLKHSLAVLLGGVIFCSLVFAEEKKDVRITRQGGYVEKLDPNVDYQDRLPRIVPRAPKMSLEAFHPIPGFRIELAASEPLIADAVDMAFDENGRLYVCEMIPYAEGGTSKFGSPDGRVSVLDDTDGDGRFDRRTVLVDKLVWPTGVACYDGGVFVAAAPDLLYCKDTTGNGRADRRDVILTGFALSNPNALPNSLRWGLDHRLHGMTSTAGGELRAVYWEQSDKQRSSKAISSRGRDFSIDPATGELRLESGGSQFGMTYDVWRRKFESSNSAPIEMVMYEDRYIARNPYLAAPATRRNIRKHGSTIYPTSPPEPWRVVRTEMRVGGSFSGPVEGGGTASGYFTAACGVTIYTGDAWGPEFVGNAFVAEGAGNLIHRMKLEPEGVALAADRIEIKREFLTSDEIWFKPIQMTNAPDGNLYLADMYREIFEHPDAVPPSIKKYIDLTTGKDRGRIYRIVREDAEPRPLERLGDLPTAALVQRLEHPNGWHRVTADRLLFERQDRAAIEPLVRLATESKSSLGRMHAIHALEGLRALTADVLLTRLADPHPRVREHAVRLAEPLCDDSPAVRDKLVAMTSDADLRVRYQLAFTLGEIQGERTTDALAKLAARDVGDQWVRLAVLSSSFGRAGELLASLAENQNFRNTKNGRALLAELAEQTGLQKREDQIALVFRVLETLSDVDKTTVQGIVVGLSRGLEKSGSPLHQQLADGTRAADLLADIITQAVSTAADAQLPTERRVAAIGSLSLASFDTSSNVLAELLDSRQPQTVQVAAIRAISRFRKAEVAETIVDAWLGFTPKVRDEAVEALFARPERLTVLLEAIGDKVIRPNQLDPTRVQTLLEHPDDKIRTEALHLLKSAKVAPRSEVVAAWSDVLEMQGDTTRGKEVFKGQCAKCHRLEDVGVELGLPLNTIGDRGAETILLSVLDPNRDVNPSYLNYIVLTNDGLSVSGMITAETATSITLKRAEGETDTLLRTNIDELQNTGMSIMPEGQEKLITKQQMADVIAYLISLK